MRESLLIGAVIELFPGGVHLQPFLYIDQPRRTPSHSTTDKICPLLHVSLSSIVFRSYVKFSCKGGASAELGQKVPLLYGFNMISRKLSALTHPDSSESSLCQL